MSTTGEQKAPTMTEPKPAGEVSGGPCCTHLGIEYRPTSNADGSWTSRWECVDCGHEFSPTAAIRAEAEAATVERVCRIITMVDYVGHDQDELADVIRREFGGE